MIAGLLPRLARALIKAAVYFALGIALFAAGCQGAERKHHQSIADGSPTTPHSVPFPEDWRQRIHTEWVLQGLDGAPDIILGTDEIEATENSAEEMYPVILIGDERGWSMQKVDDWGKFWTAAIVSADRKTIWGVLDHGPEDLDWELQTWRSDDGGRNWQRLSLVRKPAYFVPLESIEIDAAGRGTLSVALEDDYIPSVPAGRYVYHTRDGGRTWSRPRRGALTSRPLSPPGAGRLSIEEAMLRLNPDAPTPP